MVVAELYLGTLKLLKFKDFQHLKLGYTRSSTHLSIHIIVMEYLTLAGISCQDTRMLGSVHIKYDSCYLQ